MSRNNHSSRQIAPSGRSHPTSEEYLAHRLERINRRQYTRDTITALRMSDLANAVADIVVYEHRRNVEQRCLCLSNIRHYHYYRYNNTADADAYFHRVEDQNDASDIENLLFRSDTSFTFSVNPFRHRKAFRELVERFDSDHAKILSLVDKDPTLVKWVGPTVRSSLAQRKAQTIALLLEHLIPVLAELCANLIVFPE